MPVNFMSVLFYVLAAALGIAAVVTLIALGATIFAVVFTYVFIPLFLIAGARWLWLKYKLSKRGKIEYFRNDE